MSRDLSVHLPERPDGERLAAAARAAGVELDGGATRLPRTRPRWWDVRRGRR